MCVSGIRDVCVSGMLIFWRNCDIGPRIYVQQPGRVASLAVYDAVQQGECY
jgi:hypothetical protein